ncbi:MBG domain-containing protein, partial [Hyphomonas beringensis]|uniref:MBG domain-containing protein n=1 Tax=Hyphomonas beringensis TaxID=1280946 RepID=UPI00138E4466
SGVLTASGTGRAMDLAALNGKVINLAGDSGLVLSGGGYRGFYADTPADVDSSVLGSYLRRYNVTDNAAYDALDPGANFVAFRYAPILTITADDASRAYGEDNPTFTYRISGFET